MTNSAAREKYNPLSERIWIGSFVNESDVIGREDDEKIINLLTSNVANSRNFSVISIVGLGGLGKTTLAQVHKNVRNHFQVQAWVSVQKWSKSIFRCNHLSGSIEISGLDNVMGSDEAMLWNKQQLKKLTTKWDEDDPNSMRDIQLDEEVIEGSNHIVISKSCV